ncbi:MAG: pyruvate ferredoxin oxidoreductase [Candidatus Latescibacteria bacterium]|nr:pyruvate ferredoxin oxidoreductase [Candidatus Latescibacterota bacterium]
MKKVITGNHAVSYGAQLARTQVISAYPITPQTQVVELLSEFCASGKLKAKFIKVESEHSAMTACIAASLTGVRTFTATSAHGLALMHEMLHWAAGARTPVVMANINRAMGPGWSVWTDQNDSLSQRDTGWIQLYCESNQEVLDTTIQAFKIAEKLLLPVMVILDAFVLSHTSEQVDLPEQSVVDQFLPRFELKTKLDLSHPSAYGGLTNPDHYFEIRYKIQKAHEQALAVIKSVNDEFNELFGRKYGVIEAYRCDDAKVILVTSGTITSTARVVIDTMREQGRKVGLLKQKLFRPTPTEQLREVLFKAQKIAVIDRNISFGHSGVFAQEIKSSLYGLAGAPPVFDYIIGLGGRDVTPDAIYEIIDNTFKTDVPNEPIIWRGVRL